MRNKQSSCHPSFSLENVKRSLNYKINKSTSSLKPACQFGVMTFICLFPFSTFAECTPTPDCASIGYTQTSCEGDYLACPFDSTKLKCLPCDSSFRYDCTGDNITGGVGESCGGKYASCICSDEQQYFVNGKCVCKPTDCLYGNIYYSDGTCSATGCLDITKTAVGVVVKDKELITSQFYNGITWGGYSEDIPNLTNSCSKTDLGGQNNTQTIVDYFGTDADTTTHAGVYCYQYSPTNMHQTKGQWYLPSMGEIYTYFYYGNYGELVKSFDKLGWEYYVGYLWSSSEKSSTSACIGGVSSGLTPDYTSKDKTNKSIACFLSIN